MARKIRKSETKQVQVPEERIKLSISVSQDSLKLMNEIGIKMYNSGVTNKLPTRSFIIEYTLQQYNRKCNGDK